MSRPTRNLIDRFWEKVDKSNPDGCWLWKGSRNKDGYGQFYMKGGLNVDGTIKADGKGTGYNYVPRIAWELTNGPIPKGKLVLHTCDNPPCCRPDHLYLGTKRENSLDAIRSGLIHFQCGENAYNAKLNQSQAREIRVLYASSKYSERKLAKQFNVSRICVRNIIQNKTYKEVR